MPISGLVVTLARNSDRALEGMNTLSAESRIEVGVRQGRKVAVVSTTQSPAEDRTLWNSLESSPGIRHLDVVFIDFDREHPS
jgi:hypothetical protein